MKTNRFYIPGETSVSERLRKSSFDCGTFTMLHYVAMKLGDKPEFTEIKQFLKEKVLNFVELNDLVYHVKVLKLLQAAPDQEEAISDLTLTLEDSAN